MRAQTAVCAVARAPCLDRAPSLQSVPSLRVLVDNFGRGKLSFRSRIIGCGERRPKAKAKSGETGSKRLHDLGNQVHWTLTGGPSYCFLTPPRARRRGKDLSVRSRGRRAAPACRCSRKPSSTTCRRWPCCSVAISLPSPSPELSTSPQPPDRPRKAPPSYH